MDETIQQKPLSAATGRVDSFDDFLSLFQLEDRCSS
jgi:hypothetical protein